MRLNESVVENHENAVVTGKWWNARLTIKMILEHMITFCTLRQPSGHGHFRIESLCYQGAVQLWLHFLCCKSTISAFSDSRQLV